MRRSAQVLLVLMGGGMVSAAAVPLLRQPECDPALQPPGSCGTNSSSSRSSGSGSWSSASRSSADAASAGTAVARGGFGATGAAHAGSGG